MSQNGRECEDVIEAALAMGAAIEVYQPVLVGNAMLLRELAKRLGSGEGAAAVVRSTPGRPGRIGAKSAEEVLEEARFRFRVVLVAACMADGMSRKEIANNMGFSRQVVDRYVRAAPGPK